MVTPRDRVEAMKNSDDLQIELLGAQAIDATNTYLQAALFNLRKVRTDLTIAERDHDRYFKSFEANFEHFRPVKRELVEEMKKVRRLESEIARGREQVLAEYKASKEFQDLLDAEYDATFPGTFSAWWEKIIAELGTQIEGVTLERFPVLTVPVPGAAAAAVEEIEEAEEEEEEEVEVASVAAGGDSEPQDHPHSSMIEDASDAPKEGDPFLTGDDYIDNLDV